jgi:hypothetical protein
MKINQSCLRCIHLYCCNLTRVTDQCPIVATKPANEPFDKEMKPTKKWRDPHWEDTEGTVL